LIPEKLNSWDPWEIEGVGTGSAKEFPVAARRSMRGPPG
jgi:hypothetical protein